MEVHRLILQAAAAVPSMAVLLELEAIIHTLVRAAALSAEVVVQQVHSMESVQVDQILCQQVAQVVVQVPITVAAAVAVAIRVVVAAAVTFTAAAAVRATLVLQLHLVPFLLVVQVKPQEIAQIHFVDLQVLAGMQVRPVLQAQTVLLSSRMKLLLITKW